MSLASDPIEDSVAKMIGESFSGSPVTSLTSTSEELKGAELLAGKFDASFDEDFQYALVALIWRDNDFMLRAAHLLLPSHFENAAHASLADVGLRYFRQYDTVPSSHIYTKVIGDALKAGKIKKAFVPEVLELLKRIRRDVALPSSAHMAECVAEFARHQAVQNAILSAVDLVEKKKFDKIESMFKEALGLGMNEGVAGFDYFDSVEDRTSLRLDKLAGTAPLTGISTGMHALDERLYHRGWGRKELAILMGGAKSGKTTGLINFAKCAAFKGYNVLYVTLEVAAGIIADRLDASITDTLMKDLGSKIHEVNDKITELKRKGKMGRLSILEYPTGTMTPAMLRVAVDKMKNKGQHLDMIVVDYADIMAPNHRTNDPIENSKSIFIDLRAIAVEENVAMLTATQTNREGYKATVAKAEHVSEDFNKIRTADLVISINATEEERKNSEARLYIAASRNSEGAITVLIRQNLAMMKFVEAVLHVE